VEEPAPDEDVLVVDVAAAPGQVAAAVVAGLADTAGAR